MIDAPPPEVRNIIGLDGMGLTPVQASMVRAAARLADRLPLISAPPAGACVRMGLPADWLYRTDTHL